MSDESTEHWWLARIGDLLIWSRLRIRPSGTAEVLDNSGNLLNYDSEDSARSALMDAEFRALDGLDDDDALAFGLPLSELVPPQGDDATLPERMAQPVPARH
ncbi:hypothetical protein OS187_07975 [Xanthomonadaceae bacterium JHOS43]|jgi:hypothetical protein|nr:hypothetical protein [Xanthomonadaceae bacterium JHOS43]MCX7564344.1 hypothetical protein [Xanthomonadaceae bacterium XH05]